ncbi:pyridoxamine 5'-phosphate oxidase family protein [Ideonella livida]|uniref:CREG-like beta-barrel domain-containing protein n=1 Tax=Ideonella livida TaxID=2707176 RepID=A0A7C9THY1_9BURK|nr:pyridoxamine 5'-phosphate oxidase family protein [Ideonella livida]NDY90861.1 hypothetical protein [Ideonella livida]
MDNAVTLPLRQLLARQPVAALATLHQGAPASSMVPFAWRPASGELLLHVSRLATHTADMLAQPAVSLLVQGLPDMADTPLALPRAAFSGQARPLAPGSEEAEAAQADYLARLPDAAPLFNFGDFGLFAVQVRSVRLVAGFGRAHSLTTAQWQAVAATAPLGLGGNLATDLSTGV